MDVMILKPVVLLNVLLMGLFNHVHSQTTVHYCGNTPADVVFLLDSSNSMWAPHFHKQLQFVSSVVQMFQIGENTTRVGLAIFNDAVHMQFYLNEYKDQSTLQRAISQVEQVYGMSTATDKALRFMRTRLFSRRHGARSGVAHIGIVITDGQSDNTLKTLIEATRTKKDNIILFTIGVGKDVNGLELERMASSPASDYAFVVDSFSFLDTIKEKLAIKTCTVTAPPPTEPTTLVSTSTTATTTITTSTTTTAETTTPFSVRISSAEEGPDTTTRHADLTSWIETSPAPTVPFAETTTLTQALTSSSWLNTVREICQKKFVDVVLALDSSDQVSSTDFWYQVKFVRNFLLGLDIGANATRVGLVMYSDTVSPVFDVHEHTSLSALLARLYQLERLQGATQVDQVLHYVRTKSFRRAVSRTDAAQIVVLISASKTKNLNKVRTEATKVKDNSIHILAIGVGEDVDMEELATIVGADASSTQAGFQNFAPYFDASAMRRRQLFRTKSFLELDSVVMEATIEACTAEPFPRQMSDQACGKSRKADLMFVMDSASAGKKNTRKSLDFVGKVAGAMEIGQSSVQIGTIQPDECLPHSHSLSLNSHNDKHDVVTALQSPSEDDTLASLLKRMRRSGFGEKNGGRKNAKKIAIVMVDGELMDPLKALKEARRAQVHGVEIYIILVGAGTPQPELQEMCAYPPQEHFFQVPNYDKLKDLEDSLIDALCDVLQ